MVISLANVKDNQFLGEGKHLVKIANIEEVTTEWGTQSLKITFVDRNSFHFNEFFSLDEKFLWKLKALAKAVNVLDSNENLDTNNLLNKYLYITIGTYKNKDGKEFLTIKKFEKSNLTPQNTNQTNQQSAPPAIDDEGIPF